VAPELSAPFRQEGRGTLPADFDLEQRLAEICARAHQAWPGLDVADVDFASYLAERTPSIEALEGLCTDDLYLACACMLKIEGAARALHSRYAGVVTSSLSRLRLAEAERSEVLQVVLERFLVGRGERPAALALYAGHGDLGSYLRVVSIREGLALCKKRNRNVPEGDKHLEQLVDADDDPELVAMKQRHRDKFKRAFQGALQGLTARQRNLLRYHYVDNLTTREIGAICGGSSSTISRQLARVRAELLHGTRSRLAAELGLGHSDFASLARLIQSQLDLSIVRVLREPLAPRT